MPHRTICTALLVVFTAAALSVGAAADGPIPYPTGFRDWAVVKSVLIQSGNPSFATEGGIHHIYANPAALAGYRSGSYADGATIVYELVETHETNHAITEGARLRVDVMVRDSKRFASSGGWGFERFKHGNEQERAVGDKTEEMCFGCHRKQEAKSFVFSVVRE